MLKIFKKTNKAVKKMDWKDVAGIKWSVLAITLALVSAIPAFASWVVNTHWIWFAGLGIIFMIRPTKKWLKA